MCRLLFLLSLAAVMTGHVMGQAPDVDQAAVDDLAQSLDLQWEVVTNVREVMNYNATLTVTNRGSRALDYGNWTIYFYAVYPVTGAQPGLTLELPGHGLKVMQVNGMLYKLWPSEDFRSLQQGHRRVLRFHMKYWSVSLTDSFPNWYLVGSPGTQPRVIASTAGLDPVHVAPYSLPQQQKRYDYDNYPATSAQRRYARAHVPLSLSAPDAAEATRIIPRPRNFTRRGGGHVALSSAWRIYYDTSPGKVNLSNEVAHLTEKLKQFSITPITSGQQPSSDVIVLSVGDVNIDTGTDDRAQVLSASEEAYILTVDDALNVVTVQGRGASGVFRGLQSLLALLRSDGRLPAAVVQDAPRFEHRGLFLDVSRNFHGREELERLLRVMALYKLNKLHLHLADDEGWRLEIPGLPELTQIGSRRCHDPEENECLLPQLGSGPFSNNSGSGFLTLDDYRSILRTAVRHHIEVIPEIDTPGHARAAIKAMELRYRRNMEQGNQVEAERYRLIEEGDPSVYTTPQAFNDNAINVCLESTYAFLTKVITEIRQVHQTIQPLREFHYGGDEVGRGAWVNSTACQSLQDRDVVANASLKQYFFQHVANITNALGLKLGAWEDGLMLQGNQPFNRSLGGARDVFVNVWDSVWEWGTAARTHNLANMGYKVVMSHATNLYFDHPHEPDSEERGYYWATRFTDSQKTFGFLPMSYYDNIEEARSGRPLTRKEVCGGDGHDDDDDELCPPLERPENIVGMQGHLWSETSRTRDHVDHQFFPRALALAERAWHCAPWETDTNVTTRTRDKMADWYSFARAVGQRELPRLDAMGIKYRVPPPGAKVEKRRLFVAPGFPGLTVEYSRDLGSTWHAADGTERVKDNALLLLRTRSADGQRYSRIVELNPVPKLPATSQTLVDYIANNVTVQYEVVDNYLAYGTDYFVTNITLTNTGSRPVPAGNWAIYFGSVQWVEPELLRDGWQHVLSEYKMTLSHDMGYLFRLAPASGFASLESGESREISFKTQYWSVSRYEQFPNYYVAAEGANARAISNTVGETLDFVGDFDKVNQWKRDSTDRLDPFSPSARYSRHADVKNLGFAPLPYLPTPTSYTVEWSRSVSVNKGWVIVAATAELKEVADFLRETLAERGGALLTLTSTTPTRRYVLLQLDAPAPASSPPPDGAYTLAVRPQDETVTISGRTHTGVLYGVQSLINMAMQSSDGATVPEITATDAPRFPFRGMFLDVSRNFHPKADVLRLLEVMGLYKLNKLHLHLADDEGWRLEIPGLPELTSVGSTRCHDPTEERCLTPVMGSGPDPDNPGTGFYTVQDYKDILSHAARRHIEVIPEFDMPGHSRAAIKAMALRRKLKRESGDEEEAHKYALDEEGDQSLYSSVQMYDDNAVNLCLNSTYEFIRHVMTEVKAMHGDVNALKTYHFGGDEVAPGAWIGSRACQAHVQNGETPADLKIRFARRVAEIARDLDLNVQAWEDGLMAGPSQPAPRDQLAAAEVYVNAWDNVWEWGAGGRPYLMANLGYKVIMSQATHLYYDHPQEPDPEERGFYWATRFTDTRKTFFFQPDHLWHNVDITRFGEPLSLVELCGDDASKCPQLDSDRRDNVVGMQGHLWSETVRTSEQLDYMIFPRLVALAERAWHRAAWEGTYSEGDADREIDWTRFANTMGRAQLPVLDALNVTYRVPLPGAKVEGRRLLVNVEFPGLTVEYATSDSGPWTHVPSGGLTVKDKATVRLRTRSSDGTRVSRTVSVEVPASHVTAAAPRTSSLDASARTVLLLLLLLHAFVTCRT